MVGEWTTLRHPVQRIYGTWTSLQMHRDNPVEGTLQVMILTLEIVKMVYSETTTTTTISLVTLPNPQITRGDLRQQYVFATRLSCSSHLSQPRTRDEPVRHSSKPQERAVSPPPHILGRIVEMGFSIQEARIALASTDTGLDVEAALEALLSNGVGTSSARPSPPPSLPRRPTNDSTSSQSPPPRRREPQTSAQAERNLQEQADKIMAQASQIGLSFLSKANAAWKEGRERVQKAYVERVADPSPEPRGSTRTPTNGRPKWMQDNNGPVNEEPEASANGVPFSDHNDDPTPNIRAQARAGPPTHTQQPPSAPIGDLLAVDDGPAKPYVSPFRRKAVAPAAPSPQPQPRKTQTPPSRPLRNLVTTSSASIATSRSHKDQGADKFKLGQYGDAETAYTRAIECLPTAHLLLIPLYNNRALVRLKTGDYAGAVADCGTVIELVDEGTWQDEQRRSKSVEEGAGVDLGDSLVKAWKRRAEALEGREKWAEAKQDWERVAGAGWSSSSLRSDGVRGAGRCRKMVAADKQEQNPAPPKPKPRPAAPKRPPARRGPTPPSQALTNLKKANDAAAAEDDEKYQLKDRVDAKLTAWRGGKETNIRALIASLDSVLWPEVGLQKTSIAELVTPSQVKIRYTKAIAKLHPDKVTSCSPSSFLSDLRFVSAECEQLDYRTKDDCEWGIWDSQRGVECIQAVEPVLR